MNPKVKKLLITVVIILVTLGVIALLYISAGKETFIRTALSGLTLGSLFFLVAGGLTLIFGLMDVLNFAHGSMFMLGAYIGWQLYTNPTFIFGLLPQILAFAAGVLLIPTIKPYQIGWKISEKWVKALPKIGYFLALVIAVVSFIGFDIMGLADTAMVAVTTATAGNPLAEISVQEPLVQYWFRPVLMLFSGALIAFASSKPGNKTEFAPREKLFPKVLIPIGLFVFAVIATLIRESAPIAILLMNGNWRFVIALLVSILFGFVFGAVVEITLIRPLYARPTFIIILTLGLSYVIREMVQLLWDPLAYQMVRPPQFAQSGRAMSLLEWLQNGSATIDIAGVIFPTYRLFVIALGIVMFIFITVLMTKTRLGMIIRAGVQDPQMVEALGINVKSVFTMVFALGIAMAA